MRNSFLRSAIILPLLLLMVSCSKIDWDDVWGHPGALPKCDLAAYTLSIYPQVKHPFLFRKTYDPSGRQVRTIDAAFFNELGPEDLIHFRLKIEYRARNIYLVNMDAPYDTSMTIKLNKYGKPESATGVDDLWSYEFFYTNNRLTSYNWKGWSSWNGWECKYDDQGNIISIWLPGGDGYFFEYDYTKKAKQQFYMDECRMLDDGMALMQYLGLFPELNPVNLRTRVSMGNRITSYYWDFYMKNHQVDNSGKLLQYDIYSCYSGKCSYSYTAKLDWNCR